MLGTAAATRSRRGLSHATLLAALVLAGTFASPSLSPAAEGLQVSEAITAPASRLILVTFPQTPSRRLPRAGSTARSYGGPRGYKVAPTTRHKARALARDYELRRLDEWPIELLGVHCVVFEVPEERTVEEMVELLSGDSRVDLVQPMHIYQVEARTYDDPYLELQRGALDLGLEEAHRWATGEGVRVAVVDTGVDVTHPDLRGRVAVAEDFVGGPALGFAREIHGTGVAGVIAAAAGNGIGIVGVAPKADVLALRACWQEGPDSPAALCNSFTLAKAIDFASRKRAAILNLSLAGPDDPLLSSMLRRAMDGGMVVVTASTAGNRRLPSFPASLAGVIAVGAAGTGATPASGSGPPSLVAPGVDVLTTQPRGGYDFMSGSSLAAAHVSGVAALLLELNPRLDAGDIAALLRRSASDSANLPTRPAGEISACAAVALLSEGARGGRLASLSPLDCGASS